MSRPLDGLLVVSLEQAIAAPYCTRLLADQGARVIKVERPDGGDFARAYDTRARGLASHFVWTNRSKESLALDLKEPAAIEALRTIIAKADVFVQNLAPGAAARLGLGPTELRAENPHLVTCSISGYGSGGPAEQRKAYDLLIQAEAGFLSVTGTRNEMAKAGISIADIAAGVTAYHSILAALINRGRTGRGRPHRGVDAGGHGRVDGLSDVFRHGRRAPPPRNGAGHATIYPYGPYDTADGGVFFGLQNDREWAAFAEGVLKRPDMAADPRFKGNSGRADHREAIEPVIVETFAALSTEEAIARLEKAGIGTARVSDMAALWAHPQLAARGRWSEVGSPAGRLPALKPVSGDGWEPRLDPVPALGQHTDAILAEFGLDILITKAKT